MSGHVIGADNETALRCHDRNWAREHKIRDVMSVPGTFKDGADNLFMFLFVVDAFIM